MYKDRVVLSPEQICDKKFKIDARGFRMKEVDDFLDVVISDYQEMFAIMKELELQKEDLLVQITNLKQEIRTLNMSIDIAKSDIGEVKDVNRLDILKRLAQLEKIVYSNKSDE